MPLYNMPDGCRWSSDLDYYYETGIMEPPDDDEDACAYCGASSEEPCAEDCLGIYSH